MFLQVQMATWKAHPLTSGSGCRRYRGPEEDEGNFDVSFRRPFDVTPLSRSKDGFAGKNLPKQTTDLLKKCSVKRLCVCHILMETYFHLFTNWGFLQLQTLLYPMDLFFIKTDGFQHFPFWCMKVTLNNLGNFFFFTIPSLFLCYFSNAFYVNVLFF